jgi:starch synthase
LNGVDYSIWNPETDRFIARNYSAADFSGKQACKEALQKIYGLPPRPEVPLLGIISRLADQKGFDLLTEVFDYLMAFDVQFVLLGTGDPEYHGCSKRWRSAIPNNAESNCALTMPWPSDRGGSGFFSDAVAVRALWNEPDVQLEIWNHPRGSFHGRIGGHRAGVRSENGAGQWVRFEDMKPKQFFWAVKRAMDLYRNKDVWTALMRRAMQQDFSWNRSAGRYEALYKTLRESRPARPEQETV